MRSTFNECRHVWSGNGELQLNNCENLPTEIVEFGFGLVGVEAEEDVYADISYGFRVQCWEETQDSPEDMTVEIHIHNIDVNGLRCPKRIQREATDFLEQVITDELMSKHLGEENSNAI